MVQMVSPGISVQEIDLTAVVAASATSIGAIAGEFNWGPANEIVTVSNEIELINKFGKPTNDNAETWFSAANFLAYSNNLKVVRASGTSTLNATVSGGGVLIENEDDYYTNHSGGANTHGEFAAKYAGELGNSLRIEMADSNTFSGWAYSGYFTDAPATSDYVSDRGGSNDELHVIVIDTLGKFSTSANTILERFSFVSKASDAQKYDGSTNYYKNVINNNSKYIWWLNNPELANTNWGTASSNTSYTLMNTLYAKTLSSGANGSLDDNDAQLAYQKFSNADDTDVSLIISGGTSESSSVAYSALVDYLIGIAESRKDCMVFASPEKTDVVGVTSQVTNVVSFRNSLTSSSYAVMDCNWKYQYDKYNDVYRWIPLNGDIAGLCARTDNERDPWYSPAGPTRGIIKNIVKLAWNPTSAERDQMYLIGINPVVTFQGQGTMLYGDKTLLSRPSAFDRINVRRLFIVLEKSISKAARSTLFEFNDQFSRAQFVNLVEPYLREVQGRRGITDFRVVCDSTNNTPEVVDRNEFVGDIFLKPSRSINFLQLRFVAVRTGVAFEEIVGKL